MASTFGLMAFILVSVSVLLWSILWKTNVSPKVYDTLGFLATASGVLGVVAAVVSASSYLFG